MMQRSLPRILRLGGQVMLALALMSASAFALGDGQSGGLTCKGGQASGTLYNSGASCPTVMGFDNIFSFLICNMEQLSSNILGSMFCGVVHELTTPFLAVVTLAVLFQSISFTLGLNPRASARDLQLFLIKISVITAFATQADYLIGIGYHFFVTSIRDGVAVVLSAVVANPSDGPATGAKLYGYLDKFLGTALKFATDYIGAHTNKDTANFCKNAIFSVMAVMAVSFPPIAYLGLLLIFRIAVTFLRAVFGYIYAIVGIAFLMVLSPFFLAFALFRQTNQFFDKWMGYLVSFTLQMILMFSFLTFVLSLDVKHVSESLPSIVMYNDDPQEGTSFRFPWEYCTLCDFKVCKTPADGSAITSASCDEIKPDTSGNYTDFISKGKLVCKNNPPKPISALNAAAPGGAGLTPEQQKKQLSTLLSFAMVGLLSLVVLAYVVEEILALVPSLSQTLAGGYGGALYAPQLGGGFSPLGRSTVKLPFEGVATQAGETFSRNFAGSSNGVSGAVNGVKEALSELLTGKSSSGRETRGNSIGDSFTDWLSDPNRIEE